MQGGFTFRYTQIGKTSDAEKNKGFRQHLMCRNPLFSAVSPIFCSFPLYQLSDFHFSVPLQVCKAVLLGVVFKDSLLIADRIALALQLVLMG